MVALGDGGAAAETLGMTADTQCQARSFHTNTWFHVRGDHHVTRTLCGTRPGDGRADLVFNIAMLEIFQEVRQQGHCDWH